MSGPTDHRREKGKKIEERGGEREKARQRGKQGVGCDPFLKINK